MPRKNIYIDEETAANVAALSPQCYPSDSEAIRVAVARLADYHFRPVSQMSDDVLEHVWRHLRAALGYIEAEQNRRAESSNE